MQHLLILCILPGGLSTDCSNVSASPAIGFDVANAINNNQYFLHFYAPQVLGIVIAVGGEDNLIVTDLGAFDMSPANEPVWDPEHPLYAEDGFKYHHAVALFERSSMETIAEIIIPAGTEAPIQDEGYRYLEIDDPVVLVAGGTYVLPAWWPEDGYESRGMDAFYLFGTDPEHVPSEVYTHESITITESCFNFNGGDGHSVPAPVVFGMFWGMYADGANFPADIQTPVNHSSWGEIKSLFRWSATGAGGFAALGPSSLPTSTDRTPASIHRETPRSRPG